MSIHAKEYETIYVLRPDVDAETAEKVQARFADVVARESGVMLKVESWGRRRLAYTVAKQKRGVYIYVRYVGVGGLVTELERNLRLADSVLKFQTVRLNDDVDMASFTVNAEDVKFERLELPPEEDDTNSRERALGLNFDAAQDNYRGRGDREDRHAQAASAEGETVEAGEEVAGADNADKAN